MLLLSNFMLLALKPSALVRLGDDKSWVWINDHIAESSIWTNDYLPLNWTEWKLDKKQCESEDFDKTVFSEKAGISVRSVDRICENFSSGSLSDTINNIIKNQKLAWVLAIYPFIFTIICFLACYAEVLLLNFIMKYITHKINIYINSFPSGITVCIDRN